MWTTRFRGRPAIVSPADIGGVSLAATFRPHYFADSFKPEHPMRILIAVAAFLTLAGCSRTPVLAVDGVWVRLNAVERGPAAAYFTVHGGPKADRLLSVTSDVVIRIELHESMASGNMASMKPITGGIDVPAGGTIEFKPGGRHAMLYYVNPGIKPPRTLPLTFTFASGNRIEVDAQVALAGDK
jgi:periplasmic copper chaperone A